MTTTNLEVNLGQRLIAHAAEVRPANQKMVMTWLEKCTPPLPLALV
jgi:hypothetical protein